MSKEPPRNKRIYDRSASGRPQSPRPPAADPRDVWMKVDALTKEDAGELTKVESSDVDVHDEEKERRRKRRKRAVHALDVVGTALWLYAIVKLFVGNWDQDLLALVAPKVAWVLDWRFFIALGMLAMMLLLFKARRV